MPSKPRTYCSRACQAEGFRQSPEAAEAAFWSLVDKRSNDACWEWLGHRNTAGYGVRSWEGKPRHAHRISWELHNGPIPDGMLVCHHCDNPPCVNPGHLFLGTVSDNAQDKVRKGRDAKPTSKLTPEKVRDIRQRHANGETIAEIAREFDVNTRVISNAVQRITWKLVR